MLRVFREGILMERGAASILVELKEGKVYVYHGSDKALLAQSPEPVEVGTWDRLWEALEQLGVERL